MVPKTFYRQPLIQLRALIILLVLILTARKLKAHQSGQWLVIRETLPRKEILNSAKIKLNSSVHAWISTDPTSTLKLNYTEKVNKMRNILSCRE